MILKLVSSLAPGSNKFLREATKQHNLFDFLSSIATPRAPFLNFLLTPTEHISGSFHRDFTITFKFFFQFIGTDPNAPHYHRNHSCPYILQFSNFSNRSWYFSAFSSSFSFPGPSSGIATSIFWQLLSLLKMITKSSLLAPNFMVWWDTEVPQMFEIVIFTEHNFRDMVITPFISLNPHFPARSQWMAIATLSSLLLYSFCASVAHELTIWLMMMIHYCNKQE